MWITQACDRVPLRVILLVTEGVNTDEALPSDERAVFVIFFSGLKRGTNSDERRVKSGRPTKSIAD